MFLKRMSTGNKPSSGLNKSHGVTASTSTPKQRTPVIAFTDPFHNNEALASQPRQIADLPVIRTDSGSAHSGSYISQTREDSTASTSDDSSANYDASNERRVSKLFDIEAFRNPDYRLAHPSPQNHHRKRSSVSIKSPTFPIHRTRSSTSENGYSNRGIRERSPSPNAFQPRVAFRNLDAADTLRHNIVGVTLREQHGGFRAEKLSRTFLVGLDDQEYSQDALKWLLESMVDDGDSVVCFWVHEKEAKQSNAPQYYQEAKKVMSAIQKENKKNKAIQITLEYVFGKLQTIFRKLIAVYQPGMVIVGTKGKNSQGIQAVWTARNSFSKYCLQYSPVPVVVVRPKMRRNKKKEKRSADPGRHEYRDMLDGIEHEHELDMNLDDMEKQMKGMFTADEEAHHVARAIGLPASFDPLIKGIDPSIVGARPSAPNGRAGSRTGSPSGMGRSHRNRTSGLAAQVTQSLERNGTGPKRLSPLSPGSAPNSAPGSDDESDGSEGEGEDAVKPAAEKLERLHQMERQEAKVLGQQWDDSDDEDGDGKA